MKKKIEAWCQWIFEDTPKIYKERKYDLKSETTKFIEIDYSTRKCTSDVHDTLLWKIHKTQNTQGNNAHIDNLTVQDIYNTSKIKKTPEDICNLLISAIWKENICFFYRENWNIEFSQETLDYLSNIMNEAMYFYENVLFRKIPQTFLKNNDSYCQNWKIKFKKFADIQNFFENAYWCSGVISQVHCSLLKIAYTIWSMKQHNELSYMDYEIRELLQENILEHFQSRNSEDLFSSVDFHEQEDFYENLEAANFATKPNKKFTTKSWKESPSVQFKLSAREKTPRSIALKMLSQPQYDEFDALNDLFGLKAEVKTREDAIKLLEYIYFTIFEEKGKIKDKNILDQNLIQNMYPYLSYDFSSKLNSLNTEKKERTADNYQDIKISWYINGKPVEFQIVLVGNSNETWGYSHRKVLECQKVIETAIRLEWYVSKAYIKKVINNFVKSSPDLWYLGNQCPETTKENIFWYLTTENKNFLNIYFEDESFKNYYTRKDIWNRTLSYWMVPENAKVSHPKLTKGEYVHDKV